MSHLHSTYPPSHTKKEEMLLNPLYTGRLFHCYMLVESICHFRGVMSILSLLFYFLWKILLANTEDPDQMLHYNGSDNVNDNEFISN